jgi:hypothetical protein
MVANEVDRFALLLAADAKLGAADQALKRAGLAKEAARIATLRAGVARALAQLQDHAYAQLDEAPSQRV